MVLLSLTILGCNDSGPPLGIVSGTITLDGEPLEGAQVTFDPLFSDGSPAYSKELTDENGYYEMWYQTDRKGVLIGEHTVYIQTEQHQQMEDGRNIVVPERVPARYNQETELKITVEKGKQEKNFDLTSE
jgi:hypothetical protein